MRKLLLPCSDSSFKSEVISSCALPVEKRKITWEYAGKAFHAFQRRANGLSWEKEKIVKKKQESVLLPPPSPSPTLEDDDDEDNLDKLLLKDQKDYYALLGISHLGLNASEKQIKKAYQETILKTHPDKIRPDATKEERDAANAVFRDVQAAYEILSDVEKRRGYDSQFEFDDAIPSGMETIRDDAHFLAIYGPVFEANARFSITKPVPLLGKADDEEDTVKKMYNFWRTFRSWRDFSAFDEFKNGDLETAEGRDHRRYMLKKNEQQREKRKKKEFARIQLLVERAYKNDPRIIRFKQQSEKLKEDAAKAREAAKKALEDAKKREEEEKERIRLENERMEIQRKGDEKREKNLSKQIKRKAIKQIETLLTELKYDPVLLQVNIELLSTSITPVELQVVADGVVSENSPLPFDKKCEEIKMEQERKSKEEEEKRQLAAQQHAEAQRLAKAELSAKRALVWTPEGLSFLAKGMAKYPGGTRNRWQCISQFVNTSCGFETSPDDCIEASKKLAQVGPNKAATATVLQTSTPPTTPQATTPTPVTPEEPQKPKEWTIEEQRLLEAALREFPNSMEVNERWTAIANKIGTRNKKECAARVKELKSKVNQ